MWRAQRSVKPPRKLWGFDSLPAHQHRSRVRTSDALSLLPPLRCHVQRQRVTDRVTASGAYDPTREEIKPALFAFLREEETLDARLAPSHASPLPRQPKHSAPPLETSPRQADLDA